jgi:uroporphyrinogen-III synthase
MDVLELPCVAHCHAEGYPSLARTLDEQRFDYVVITSPEVRPGWWAGCSWGVRI